MCTHLDIHLQTRNASSLVVALWPGKHGIAITSKEAANFKLTLKGHKTCWGLPHLGLPGALLELV